MFSQRDEEKYILSFFKNNQNGRFLDIGAYDGKTFSNTRQLALNGWGGICVEPSPSLHKALEDLYGANDRISIMKIGVGLENGVFPFYNFYGDAIGTFDKKHAELWEGKGGRKSVEIKIPVVSVDNLFAEIEYDFEFINIDTEGWSLKILKALPFSKLSKTKMICVEFDYKSLEVLQIVRPYGFEKFHQTAENLIVVRE